MSKLIIDVREAFEFASGHVSGAINIPLGQLQNSNRLADTSKDSNIVVYCRTGSRSAVAQNILQQQGFNNVVNGINQQNIESS
jgi:phage shock protein E